MKNNLKLLDSEDVEMIKKGVLIMFISFQLLQLKMLQNRIPIVKMYFSPLLLKCLDLQEIVIPLQRKTTNGLF